MTPQDFIDKWSRSELKERAGSQEHFIDLCRLLDEPMPAEADGKGDWYTFERGAMKTGGGDDWADVWKKGHFAWEYKGRNKDLDAAFAQLQRYAIALENPPLLIVSDMQRFIIHTNWTNTVQEKHELTIDELLDARRRQVLKHAFSDPKQLRPRKTRQDLTEEVARQFARLALQLRERGHDAQIVAHFVNRLAFCMFAEDVNLLPDAMFTRMLEHTLFEVEEFPELSRAMFAAMQTGGRIGFEKVEWFNGGLFDDDETLPLTREDIKMCLDVARKNWSNIDPSIMGTLFERSLDPNKRSQLGAHYTDRDKIMLIVNPVVVEPLTREWEESRAKIEALMERHRSHKAKAEQTKAYNEAQRLHRAFVRRLASLRVLDPACGSGNFLYLSLLALKDLEHRVNLDAEALGLPREFPSIGPECVKGIEINPFAAELARVSVWVGEIQWMQRNGFNASKNPVLKPLDTIEWRDALLNEDGEEAEWPEAEVIVGNPPFLGGKLLITYLGEDYVRQMFRAFDNAVPREADLVTYWFAKAAQHLEQGKVQRVGLVATNSIRGGANRRVLSGVQSIASIYDAWDDEPWVVEGAAVRVALVCFAARDKTLPVRLDGNAVDEIYADLTAGKIGRSFDLTQAERLRENRDVTFMGDTKGGGFDVPGETARRWLMQPQNPNGRSNSDVLRPWVNGMDLTRRPRDMWIIDFGWDMSEAEAAAYERPFEHILAHVYPMRQSNRRETYKSYWWRHVEPRQGMHGKLAFCRSYIATPTVAKHRLFAEYPTSVLPDHQLIVIACDDGTTFGILHSRFHELWSLRMCTWLGKGNDPRYTPTTCFETFPFPEGLTPNVNSVDCADDPRAKAIDEAAKRLNELRENWLNPEDLVERVPEVVEGYPDRIVPKDEKAAAILKKRTLTNLYNERPAWLDHAHRALDEAVAAAYGWPADLSDEEILEGLFKLNQERAAKQGD